MSKEAYSNSGVQQVEGKQLYVQSTVDSAFEKVIDPKADPPVQSEIQLKNGWRNGNIKIGTGVPNSDLGHDWDVYLDTPGGSGWVLVSAIYVKRP